MLKLSKHALVERARIAQDLREKHEALDSALDAFNQLMERQWAAVEQARELYSEAVADARLWCEDQVRDLEEYYGERSERWQESDRGQAYRQWIDGFEQNELQDIELAHPEMQTLDYGDQAELIEDLQEVFE